jgi:hypothetical protein
MEPLLRPVLRWLPGLLGFALTLLLPWLPALATPAPSARAPAATEERMALYQKLAAVNYCVARSAGLADSQALPLAAQTIAVILRNEHGGRIARVGDTPLPGDALLQGSVELTLLGAAQLCEASVPEELIARLEARRVAAGEAG